MEPIILLIISLIVGSLFKGKDNQKPPAKKPGQTQAPPPRQDVPRRPAEKGGSLKDLTKQLYEDLQKEIQKEAGEFRNDPRTVEKKPVQPKPEVATRSERVPQQITRTSADETNTARNPRPERTHERTRDRKAVTEQPIYKTEIAEPGRLLPESEEDLARAIVFAEILGPPKAKRR